MPPELSYDLPLVDLVIAGRTSMGQDPIRITIGEANSDAKVGAAWVTWPYGRLGNNLYQIANAALVALGAGLPRLRLAPMPSFPSLPSFEAGGLAFEGCSGEPAGPSLAGSFYVPFGCEEAVLQVDATTTDALARELCNALFADSLEAAEDMEPRISVAFRGDDVFTSGSAVPSTYVQPPVAYYLRAIAHARAADPNSLVDLVYADRSNPALPIVEDRLTRNGVRFCSRSGDVQADFARLCAAHSIVSCPSTFVEAAALSSRRLRTLSSFREHASQSEFRPFMQWRFPRVLRLRGVEGVLIDDASRSYTNKWTWAATPAQLDAIRTFDPHNLRLYRGL